MSTVQVIIRLLPPPHTYVTNHRDCRGAKTALSSVISTYIRKQGGFLVLQCDNNEIHQTYDDQVTDHIYVDQTHPLK